MTTIVTGEQSKAIAAAAIEQVQVTLTAIAYLETISEQIPAFEDLGDLLEPMLLDVRASTVNTLEALQQVLPANQRVADVGAYIDDFIDAAKDNAGPQVVARINEAFALKAAA